MPKSKRTFINKCGGDSDEENETEEELEETEDSEVDESVIDESEESGSESEEEEDEEEENSDEESDEITSDTDNYVEEEYTAEDEEPLDVVPEDIKQHKLNWHVVDKEDRITDNFISEYEYVRALSIRSKQIMLGAKILLKNADELRKKYTPKEIAKLEIKNKTCPLIIVREVPNGNIEKWSINELDILFDIFNDQ